MDPNQLHKLCEELTKCAHVMKEKHNQQDDISVPVKEFKRALNLVQAEWKSGSFESRKQ